MLRIKRAVQASYNTESSFIAAQTAAAKKGEKSIDAARAVAEAADPMAGLEREAAGSGGGGGKERGPAPAFVASTLTKTNGNGIDEQEGAGEDGIEGDTGNPEAINIDEEDI